MGLAADLEVRGGQRPLDCLDQLVMRDWHPGASGCRSVDFSDLIEFHCGRSTMKQQVWFWAFGGSRGLFEEMDHDVVSFLLVVQRSSDRAGFGGRAMQMRP